MGFIRINGNKGKVRILGVFFLNNGTHRLKTLRWKERIKGERFLNRAGVKGRKGEGRGGVGRRKV